MLGRQIEFGFAAQNEADRNDPGASGTMSRAARSRKVIQDLLLPEGWLAIREADKHPTTESLRDYLTQSLPQQSRETRTRYASSVLRWFFPEDEPRSLAVEVHKTYGDDVLTGEIMRVLYLKAEPIVGRCVAEFLFPIQENAIIPASYFDTYLSTTLGDIPQKSRGRLKQNLRKLGFLAKAGQGKDALRPMSPSATSLFLVITYYFAREEPRTLEMRTILADPFWKHLGFKSEDSVRKALRSAHNDGFLAKYVVADRIEAITTRYNLRECLDQRVKL